MQDIGKANSPLKQKLAAWAKAQAFEHHSNIMKGTPTNTLSYRIAKNIVFDNVRYGS